MQTLICFLVALTTVYSFVIVKDESDDDGLKVNNAVDADTATNAINCNLAVNSLFAHTAVKANNAKYAEKALNAGYTEFAKRAENAGHAFKAKRAKHATYSLFAYEAGKIVQKKDIVEGLHRPGNEGDQLDIDAGAFVMREDNCSKRCGTSGDGRECKNAHMAFTADAAVNAVNCNNSIYATKADIAANAGYANLSQNAETAGEAMNAKHAQKAKFASNAEQAVYAYLAERANFTLKLRPNPNKPVAPEDKKNKTGREEHEEENRIGGVSDEENTNGGEGPTVELVEDPVADLELGNIFDQLWDNEV